VLHPGVKPRNFEEWIKKTYAPKFHEHMGLALAQARGKARHPLFD
jgi:hypothetical protein